MQEVPEDEINVAFVGSRDFKLIPLVYQAMKRVGRCTVISGGARGVDQAASDASHALGYPKKIMRADWGKYGKSAGPRRNQQMVDASDAAMVFWDGKSKGTQDFMKKAIKKDIPMVVFESTSGPQKIMVTRYKIEGFDDDGQLKLQRTKKKHSEGCSTGDDRAKEEGSE